MSSYNFILIKLYCSQFFFLYFSPDNKTATGRNVDSTEKMVLPIRVWLADNKYSSILLHKMIDCKQRCFKTFWNKKNIMKTNL